MAIKKTVNTQSEQEELAGTIIEALNKTFKEGTVAYTIGAQDTPTDLTDFVSTGASLLDIAIANRLYAGIACGRISELSSLEGVGKSLVVAHMIASVQAEGGVAVLLDTENAVNEEFFRALGVDFSKVVYGQPDNVEDAFMMIEKIIETVRKSGKNDKKVFIAVDSLSQISTKAEAEADYEKNGYGTDKARMLSQAMRKIVPLIAKKKIALVFVSQLREKLNAMPFGEKYTSSGGKAVGFAASTRIRLVQVAKIKNKAGDIIGATVKATVTKNRLGPPHKSVEFNIYFDRGIDDIDSWFKYCKDKDIIKGTSKLSYVDSNGEEHTFAKNEWKALLRNKPELKKEIYEKMGETMIMPYSTEDITDDDIDIEMGDE